MPMCKPKTAEMPIAANNDYFELSERRGLSASKLCSYHYLVKPNPESDNAAQLIMNFGAQYGVKDSAMAEFLYTKYKDQTWFCVAFLDISEERIPLPTVRVSLDTDITSTPLTDFEPTFTEPSAPRLEEVLPAVTAYIREKGSKTNEE